MIISEFIEELKKINISVTEEQLNQLNIYYNMLIEWNKKINLTRITEEKDVYLKHFYDSLTINKVIDLNKIEKICDVGTGAGFPGIVLKIIFKNIKLTLIDSLNKRILFLQEVIKKLNLDNVETIHIRMEEYSKINKEKFDLITSRAVASTKLLTEISLPSLKINGHIILLKAECEEELKTAVKDFPKLNCKLEKVEKFYLPFENSKRTIIDIVKINKTPSKGVSKINKRKKYCK